MYSIALIGEMLQKGAFRQSFSKLYPARSYGECEARYRGVLADFTSLYGDNREIAVISAPGRTEIGGNHTDHQRGRVLAGAVNLDMVCIASPNNENIIRVHSKGYPTAVADISSLSPEPSEKNSACALIRGVAEWFADNGLHVGGFDACTASEVLVGSGLSSSAAFEVAMGNILSCLYNNGTVGPKELARAGKHAENNHFGKPSGLMDQMASSVGSLVQIDFADPDNAVVEPVSFDFAARGYHLCIVDTKGSHADLTDEYSAIPVEMGAVASFFGKKYLREVDPADFSRELPALRRLCGDRAVLRAMHFFADNDRVPLQAEALKNGDITRFFELINASGESSFCRLQNIYSGSDPAHQEMTIALAVSRDILEKHGGAWRVHGGGFAGTIQAFVPDHALNEYRQTIEAIFGKDSCHVLSIRPEGGVILAPDEA